jgi:hypothetical protein
MSGFHSPRNDHTNGEEWQRRPVEVPVWWILMVSATLTVLAVSSVVMIRAYGGSLQTAGRELAARWPPAAITPTPQPRQAGTPAPSPVSEGVPPSEAPPQEGPYPSGPIPGITFESVRAALEQRGVHCDQPTAASPPSGLNCSLPNTRLVTEVGATGPDSSHVWLVSCHIYYAYVDTPPSQDEMLRCFDPVIAAAESGAQLESDRAWIRTHIHDTNRVTTTHGLVSLLFDPRRGSLDIEGGL